MNLIKNFSKLLLGAALLVTFSAAQATVITGHLWRVPELVTQNAVPANVPALPSDVDFDVNSPFNFNATNQTIGNWLASSGAFNIVENTAGTLVALMDNFVTGTIVEFTGFVSVTNGQNVSVVHDDGLTLIIGGVDLGFSPAPTAPVTTNRTYTGASGNQPFQLVYAECCGGPAVLKVDLPFSNVPVPEPASLALLGLGLVGLGFGRRTIR